MERWTDSDNRYAKSEAVANETGSIATKSEREEQGKEGTIYRTRVSISCCPSKRDVQEVSPGGKNFENGAIDS
jgi:hypothetical protein